MDAENVNLFLSEPVDVRYVYRFRHIDNPVYNTCYPEIRIFPCKTGILSGARLFRAYIRNWNISSWPWTITSLLDVNDDRFKSVIKGLVESRIPGFQDSFQVRGHNLPCGRNLRYARYLPCGRNLLQLPFGAYMPCRASNIVYLQRITQSKLLLITRSKLLLFSLHPLTPGTLNPFQQYEIMLSRVHADYKILLQ